MDEKLKRRIELEVRLDELESIMHRERYFGSATTVRYVPGWALDESERIHAELKRMGFRP